MFQLGTALLDGQPTPVIRTSGKLHRLDTVLGEAAGSSLDDVFADWPEWRERIGRALPGAHAAPALDEAGLAWLPPIARPPKLICIGTNYTDHIAEMAVPDMPRFPYAFLKPTTTLAGSGATVALPKQARMVDWEAELAVVIGRRVRDVRGETATGAVAGYAVLNDLSARDWIADRPSLGIDWVMQKAHDGFAPMGPFITPAEFVPDPQSLSMRLTVNGQVMQDSNTSRMVFGVREIIEHLAGIMPLEPGDVIATGTPAGVGYGRTPRVFLKPGDLVAVTIERLGHLETRFA